MSTRNVFVMAGVLGVMGAACASAQAPWDEAWTYKRAMTFDASAIEAVSERVDGATVLVRLHSGNLDFTQTQADGRDLRFVRQSDGTPLDYHFERFDRVAEIAYVWVKVPEILPGQVENFWVYYGNDEAVSVESARQTYDGYVSYALHLEDEAGIPQDVSANDIVFRAQGLQPVLTGMVGAGMELTSQSVIAVQSHPTLAINDEAGALSVAMWLRPQAPAQADEIAEPSIQAQPSSQVNGEAREQLIFSKNTQNEQGALRLVLRDYSPVVQLGDEEWVVDETLSVGQWSHLALVGDDTILRLQINGEVVFETEFDLPAFSGAEYFGAYQGQSGFIGAIDEIYRANQARSVSHIALMANNQGARSNFVGFSAEPEQTHAAQHDYFGILIGALTPDAWAVIILLGFMSLISWMIMFSKGLLFGRTHRLNQHFLTVYREHARGKKARAGLTGLELSKKNASSSLARLFSVGQDELNYRITQTGQTCDTFSIAPESVAAIRSAINARAVKEDHRLGRWMVLLTIAISGGPFLGLLGTVLGVMITFAGVAAAGEVNVTAIAPGIAAALLATVAGLAVAIPALFGYNYLTGQLDNILADNQVFIDQLEKNIAESFRDGAELDGSVQ
ncbi:DUF2341 domain-containing protein [Woodsholea maritima]|uniref:DUF2341 domain-containing protein n=1 Tax=Woodsholea maritima TaxID=240237 RepID=UPI00146152E4|nr:DUF2341 domain-containing protein [Woodsholea maritima]